MPFNKAAIIFSLVALGSCAPRRFNRGPGIQKRDSLLCQISGQTSSDSTITLGGESEGGAQNGQDFSSSMSLALVNSDGSEGETLWSSDEVNPIDMNGVTISTGDTGLAYDIQWTPHHFLDWSGCDCSYNGFTNSSTSISSDIYSSPFYNSDDSTCFCSFPCDKVVYAPGRCGVHVTQHQKPDPATDSYSYDVTMYDNNHAKIGEVNGVVVPTGETYDMTSQLPYTFEITSGPVDDSPVGFAYAGYVFDSNSGCSTGAYDSGDREMDCGFAC